MPGRPGPATGPRDSLPGTETTRTNKRPKQNLKKSRLPNRLSWLGDMGRADQKTVSIDPRPTEPSIHLAFDGRSRRYRDAT